MLSKEEALKKVESLVERFDEQKEFYKKADYNEAQTRLDFINPFWKALGWDVDNENGYAESYREVIYEDKIKIGGATKAPDYSFRLHGGKRLFFLEAKKPSIEIKEDAQPAYQIRRYGWSAKMAISVITDFEEFAVYDCTNKPKPTDKASNGRIKYITYDNYIKEFDFLWDTFSKERVLKGSFDKYITSDKNKKGTTTVDHDFLTSLDKWRIELAKNIALRNKDIEEDELNFLVQSTLDRIIFLRIAEDRAAEQYGDLQVDIKQGDYYKNLLLRFAVADQKYNSGLFDFKKDTLSKRITIDNKVIKSIISELYYPVCPYEFSVLSVEILGSAYEQFLGKRISLSKSGRATIEEKPEVRKAGGVYYTPQYIVDYIVKNTVGKLIENKTPKEVSEIKICDPACGSGSFLIGAYDYLLRWHKDFYTQNGSSPLFRRGVRGEALTPQGELTTAEKKRILLNNIFGVDLDSNAVEVTKLSLLLKCMEGETKETLEAQTKIFHDRILPTLDNNIKSGNSLIDLDYYDGQIEFSGEERRIKPFSWQKNFPEVFKNIEIEPPSDKKLYHVTCVMHNTRCSKRMIEYNVKTGTPEFLNLEEEHKLLEIICQHIKEYSLEVLALNVSGDHLHFCIATEEKELGNVVGRLKSMSARAFNIWRGVTEPLQQQQTRGHAPLSTEQATTEELTRELELTRGQTPSSIEQSTAMQQTRELAQTRGHAPLSNTNTDTDTDTRGQTQVQFWAQKFNRVEIQNDTQLADALYYIENNRLKHELPPLNEDTLQLIKNTLTNYDDLWKPKIIKGGFDCVIGNPPWVSLNGKFGNDILSTQAQQYLINKYNGNTYMPNLYEYFVHKGLELINENGFFSFIVPDRLGFNNQFISLRKKILQNFKIDELLYKAPFPKIVTDTLIFRFTRKRKTENDYKIIVGEFGIATQIKTSEEYLQDNEYRFFYESSDEASEILNKIFANKKCKPLGEVVETTSGFGGKSNEITDTRKNEKQIEVIRGRSIQKFSSITPYFFEFKKENITGRTTDRNKLGIKEKVLLRKTGFPIIATYDESGIYPEQSLYFLFNNKTENSLKYITALINSKLFQFVYINKLVTNKDSTPQLKKVDLDKFPVFVCGENEMKSHNEIIKHVEQLLQLNKDLQTTTLPEKSEQLKQRIEYIEGKINELVYALYGLGEEDIKIIEK